MDYRETTVTVYGTTHTVRTERTGTVRQMETAHTRAVRATLEELHAAGKDQALAAAKATARKADAKARNHNSGPDLIAAQDAHRAVKRIEKRKFEAPSFPNFKAMTRPHPPVKFDLDPTDTLFADCHEFIDPNATVEPPAVEEPRPPMGAKNFLASLLASVQPPAPVEEPAAEEPMDLEEFLNDFFAPTTTP
ncbi:hypothetical protein [Streptomyces chryseus]|uniref:Uncharacterized protein n=2 Tax=Streptomyces chryseus TaxID=68186 RepID=A0ABQ3DP47_9ACTN|nr:hypothetical protein [Streptomyces chryseus]GHA94469.1 hypothetical protein GCM10010346_16540 [Streptomyces chryseus]